MALILFLLTCSILLSLYRIGRYKKWENELLQEHRIEQSRAKFAEARQRMFMLAAEGKIDTMSETYLFFNYLNTVFLRRPERYPAISQTLVDAFFSGSHSKEGKLKSEKGKLDKDIMSSIELTTDALGHLIFEYSRGMRLLKRVYKTLDPRLTHRGMLAYFVETLRKNTLKSEKKKLLRQLKRDKRKQAMNALKESIANLYDFDTGTGLRPA